MTEVAKEPGLALQKLLAVAHGQNIGGRQYVAPDLESSGCFACLCDILLC